MRYELQSMLADPNAQPPIVSRSQYRRFGLSQERLVAGMNIEERFALLVENFAEHEADMLRIAVNRVVFGRHSWDAFADERRLINRRLANCLTSASMYRDQLSGDLQRHFGKRAHAAYDKARRAQFDCLLGYRAMEFLRNHAQHRGIPVTLLSYRFLRDKTDDLSKTRIVPCLNLDLLAKDPKFKKPLHHELNAVAFSYGARKEQHISITPLLREYLQGLSCIHETYRRTVVAQLKSADLMYRDLLDKAKKHLGTDDAVQMCSVSSAGDLRVLHPVSKEIVERRHMLGKTFKHVGTFVRSYISSEAKWD